MLNIADSWKRSQRYIQNWKPITLFTSRSGWLLVFFMKDWLVCRHSPASRAVVIMCKRDANWEWKNHHLNNKSCFFWNVLVAVLRVINQPLLSLPEGNGLLFLISLAFFTVLLLLKLAGNFTSFVQATGNKPVADYLRKDGAVAIFGSNHSGKKYFLQWLTGGHQLVCRQVWLMGQNFVGIHQKLIYKIFKKHCISAPLTTESYSEVIRAPDITAHQVSYHVNIFQMVEVRFIEPDTVKYRSQRCVCFSKWHKI